MVVVSGLMLFLLFCVTMLLVLVYGASGYKNISESMDEQYRERTCLNYITAKVRHYDAYGSIYLTDFNGIRALAMDEAGLDDLYTTYIYFYDGYLYELYAPNDNNLLPSDGRPIIAMDDVSFSQISASLFRVQATANGRISEVLLASMAAKGGVQQ